MKVIPNSSKDEVVGYLDGYLKIKVRAKAEKGMANRAVELLMSASLNIAKSNIKVVKGEHSKYKTLEVYSITETEFNQQLDFS